MEPNSFQENNSDERRQSLKRRYLWNQIQDQIEQYNQHIEEVGLCSRFKKVKIEEIQTEPQNPTSQAEVQSSMEISKNVFDTLKQGSKNYFEIQEFKKTAKRLYPQKYDIILINNNFLSKELPNLKKNEEEKDGATEISSKKE